MGGPRFREKVGGRKRWGGRGFWKGGRGSVWVRVRKGRRRRRGKEGECGGMVFLGEWCVRWFLVGIVF